MCPCDILSSISMYLHRVFEHLVNSRAVTHAEVHPMEHSDFDGCNCVANDVLQPRSCSHQNHYVTSGTPQHD